MVRYEKRILHALLDSYENSVLSRGENKVRIHIAFSFTRKNMPEYFDESSVAFEDIHTCVKELQQKGYLIIVWKKGKENHIIQKVLLNESNIGQVYAYLNRVPKADLVGKNLRLLKELEVQYDTPVAGSFITYLQERISQSRPVKEFIELQDLEGTKRLIQAVAWIEKNDREYYIREFSIIHFGDSKILETFLGKIEKIMHRFEPRFAESDIYAILAEYSIYHTPNYVYLKGEGRLYFEGKNYEGLELRGLRQGIGLSGEDLDAVCFSEKSAVKRVITVENLTTYFRWWEEESMIIYLGGYHNSVRRKILKRIYGQFPDARYLHFGDIDIGGFEIYEDLCRKTGIAFKTYHMGIAELKKYEKFAKRLTKKDQIRLEALLAKKRDTDCPYYYVLEYMMIKQIKLEQECMPPAPEFD